MNLQTARKILLCLRYGIGDVVMQLPAIATLRQTAPAAQITAIGAEPAIELLAGDRRIDRVLSVQTWGFTHWGDPGSAAAQAGIRAWLAAERFDLILDPSHAVLGIGEAIWTSSKAILDSGEAVQNAALAQTGCGISAVRAAVRNGWGVDVAATAVPHLDFTAAEQDFAARFLQAKGVIGFPVGLSPVASSPLKRWPTERFFALARRLTAAGFDILLFTGPEPAVDTNGGAAGQARIVPVGPLHLRQVAALLATCRLFVGNDTGLMHMAAAAGTPLVALFGPTSPRIYLPDQVPALAIGGGEPCRWRRTADFGPPQCVVESRCLESTRGCIDRIAIEDVWQAVGARLGIGTAVEREASRCDP